MLVVARLNGSVAIHRDVNARNLMVYSQVAAANSQVVLVVIVIVVIVIVAFMIVVVVLLLDLLLIAVLIVVVVECSIVACGIACLLFLRAASGIFADVLVGSSGVS